MQHAWWRGSGCSERRVRFVDEPDAHSLVGAIDGRRLFVAAHAVYESPDEDAPPRRVAALAGVRVRRLFAGGGAFAALDDAAQLHMWGESASGQCCVVAPLVATPRRVHLRAARLACVHGQHEPGDAVGVECVAISAAAVAAVDAAGRLWQWGALLERDAPNAEPRRLAAPPFGRRARTVFAGRSHFCAVVERAAAEGSDAETPSDDGGSVEVWWRDEATALESCAACRQERDLRLSRLMEGATRRARSRPSERSLSPSDELDEAAVQRSARGLRLVLQSPLKADQASVQTLPAATPRPDALGLDALELRRPRRRSASDCFSFVNLDTAPLVDTSESDDGNCSSAASLSDEAAPKRDKSAATPAVTVESAEGALDVWTWGENLVGQLGLGDFLSRRDPCLVEKLKEVDIAKVAVGDEHNLVLTSSGEVYAWGSNLDGQLKQLAIRVTGTPTNFKIGSHSSALDIAAGSNFSAFIVNGLNFHPMVYYCGGDYTSSNITSDTTVLPSVATRLSFVEQLGFQTSIEAHGTLLNGHILPSRSANSAFIQLLFKLTFTELKFARDLQQLCQLAKDISQKRTTTMHAPLNGLPELLSKLCDGLLRFSSVIGQSARRMRQAVVEWQRRPNVADFFHVAKSEAFSSAVNSLHRHFCQLVGGACFADLQLGDALTESVEKLSLEFGAESSKTHRRIRKLFLLPFSRVAEYADFATKAAHLLPENDGIAAKLMTEMVTFWKTIEQLQLNVLQLADNTNYFWKLHTTNPTITNLRRLGRFLLKEYTKKNSSTQIKNVSLNGASQSWQHIFIFTDMLAIIEKKESLLCHFPLLWQSPVQHETRFYIQLDAPEFRLLLEFASGAAKADFAQSLNAALLRFIRFGLYGAQPTPDAAPPARRRGRHCFSARHAHLALATYDGLWAHAKPSASGKMVWPNGRAFVGKFKDGLFHGFGTMWARLSGDADDGCDVVSGFWRDGRLNGLARIQYADGAVYEGYMREDARCGHGVLRAANGDTFVGAWRDDRRQGYGVAVSQREKYLGEWRADERHGRGTIVSIDGVYHDGTFDRGNFIKGCVVTADETRFDGEFAGLAILNGKGVLRVGGDRGELIDGRFFGSLLDGRVRIASGVYERNACTPRTPVTDSMLAEAERDANERAPGVPADQRWTEMFDEVLCGALRLPQSAAHGAPVSAGDTKAAWDALVAACSRAQLAHDQQHSVAAAAEPLDDKLTRIPEWGAPPSVAYVRAVRSYCESAFAARLHPLARLLRGLQEVFALAYSGVGAHPQLLSHAVAELKSITRRIYCLLRYLFPSLPAERRMDALLTDDDDDAAGEEKDDADGRTAAAWLRAAVLRAAYPTLMTLYALQCERADGRYWRRAHSLGAASDVALLDHFGVDRLLWPIELKDTRPLDTPMACATARRKYYASAIDKLQELGTETSPGAKLRILSHAFDEINKCVAQYSQRGEGHVWSMDELCPVFLYVVIRAQLRRLGAEIRFMEDFLPHLGHLGPLEMMFTTLKACYYQIIKERTVP